jgi:hypothetical protein
VSTKRQVISRQQMKEVKIILVAIIVELRGNKQVNGLLKC